MAHLATGSSFENLAVEDVLALVAAYVFDRNYTKQVFTTLPLIAMFKP